MEQGDTRNVIVDLLTTTGFGDVEQGTVDVVTESPDVATAVRAMVAAGPSVPGIEAFGYDECCRSLTEVIAPPMWMDWVCGPHPSSVGRQLVLRSRIRAWAFPAGSTLY